MASKDGGHGMIFETFDGRKMFVLHRPNKAPDERANLTEIVEIGDTVRIKK